MKLLPLVAAIVIIGCANRAVTSHLPSELKTLMERRLRLQEQLDEPAGSFVMAKYSNGGKCYIKISGHFDGTIRQELVLGCYPVGMVVCVNEGCAH